MHLFPITQPMDHCTAMDAVWQIVRLFEASARPIYPQLLEIDGQSRVISCGTGTDASDWITATFDRQNRKYAALADLLLRLLTGKSILGEDPDFDEDSLSALLDQDDPVFTPDDLSLIPDTLGIPEPLCRAILPLSSPNESDAKAALETIKDAFRAEPCRYCLVCSSADGQTVHTTEVSVSSDCPTLLWPDGDEPTLTFSDGRTFSFRPIHLRYRPGTHTLSVTAAKEITPLPAPEPEPVPAPEPEPVPTPTPEPTPTPRAGTHVVVGIDLGTEKTCVALTNGELIELESDSTSIPSFMLYLNMQDSQIGRAAKNRGNIHPRACVTAFKRHIGDACTINGVVAVDGTPIRQTGMETSARFLSSIRQRMEESDLWIDKVVVTVPVDSNPVKRAETLRAAQLAGFHPEDIRLLDEPTAAAFYYNCHRTPGLTATYDLGGGTFDFCLLYSDENGSEVVGKGGDPRLGGADFTREITNLFLRKAESDGVDLPDINAQMTDRNAAAFYYKLRDAAERAKITLTVDPTATVSVTDAGSGQVISYEITRQEFEHALQPYLARTRGIVDDVFRRSGYNASQVERVVIIGGSTMIPAFETQIRRDIFPNVPVFFDENRISPVALGAAVFARSVWPDHADAEEPPILPLNATAQDLGTVNSLNEFTAIIPAGTEYSRSGCSGDAFFNFAQNSATYLTVGLYAKEPGVTRTQRSIFAANNPIKLIGKLHFAQLPEGDMRERQLRVLLSIDRDGVLSAEAQILLGERVESRQQAIIESV